jgi:hypothetical protein
MKPETEYRYILRDDAGNTLTRRDGYPLVYPSYMSAVRGRAMLAHRAHIIQQEREIDHEQSVSLLG